jgi:hypothetical protein
VRRKAATSQVTTLQIWAAEGCARETRAVPGRILFQNFLLAFHPPPPQLAHRGERLNIRSVSTPVPPQLSHFSAGWRTRTLPRPPQAAQSAESSLPLPWHHVQSSGANPSDSLSSGTLSPLRQKDEFTHRHPHGNCSNIRAGALFQRALQILIGDLWALPKPSAG